MAKAGGNCQAGFAVVAAVATTGGTILLSNCKVAHVQVCIRFKRIAQCQSINPNLGVFCLQMVLPIAGILSWLFLKRSFTAVNLLGTLLVLGGCLLVVLPPYIAEATHRYQARASAKLF